MISVVQARGVLKKELMDHLRAGRRMRTIQDGKAEVNGVI